ncbi:cystathionine beta-synthase-like [Anthonomus grandis grandis]|uniref:cystathionine beta-synthase-like n=1 Tax=Anthonomus grandis grandis TaxID=2921223 RepID=UPI002164F423|nr:cystathionine beta-synthase-like [Anthonomus grandis grandis]
MLCPKQHQDSCAFYSKLHEKFELPCQPSRCEWEVSGLSSRTCPHSKQEWRLKCKVYPDVNAAIGNTPLIKLNKIPQAAGLKCNVYAKCEFLNPGGSAKDRVAKRMIEDAERAGLLKPGMTVIESSSGNAGIALALQAAIKGYKAIIIISEFSAISPEKLAVLNALGAELVRTPKSEPIDSESGFIGIATKLHKEIPDSIILDQFTNPSSPLAHYDTTAEEILDALDGKVHMAVIGAGTGGTLTGLGRKLKEINPNTKIVGVDPIGSTLALPEALNVTEDNHFEVDGIGFCFISTVMDRNIVDEWVKTGDRESMLMSRRIIREEGLMVGNSSGAALTAALKQGKKLRENENLVVVFADGVRNYLTRGFVSDQWMELRGYSTPVNRNKLWWWEHPVKELKWQELRLLHEKATCQQTLQAMNHNDIIHIGITNNLVHLIGIVSKRELTNSILSQHRQPEDEITLAMNPVYAKCNPEAGLGLVSRLLEAEDYVVITKETSNNRSRLTDKPLGIVYNCDLLEYVYKDWNESTTKVVPVNLHKEILVNRLATSIRIQ